MSNKKNAAIILLGMGDACAAEILKSLNHKEVEAIIDTMNNIGNVSEQEVIQALNEFFKETKNVSGMNLSPSSYIHKTIVNAVGSDKAGSMINIEEAAKASIYNGFELLKWQPTHDIIAALNEEHPQIITVCLMCLDSDKAAEILKHLPKGLRQEVIKRMTSCKPVSQFAMESLSQYLEEQFTKPEKFKQLTADGVSLAASIIAKLDIATENEVMRHIGKEDKVVGERLEEKLFPFTKLAEMDKRSMQTLLAEVNQNDLIIALKGADDDIKKSLFNNMSAKNAALIEEDMQALGPVKLNEVFSAQKRIVTFAKKLAKEQKLFVPSDKDEAKML